MAMHEERCSAVDAAHASITRASASSAPSLERYRTNMTLRHGVVLARRYVTGVCNAAYVRIDDEHVIVMCENRLGADPILHVDVERNRGRGRTAYSAPHLAQHLDDSHQQRSPARQQLLVRHPRCGSQELSRAPIEIQLLKRKGVLIGLAHALVSSV
jgi:hypothetical protein